LFVNKNHGDFLKWQLVVENLPEFNFSSYDFINEVRLGSAADISSSDREFLREHLQKLHPWRKGPFSLFGVDIDAEWRSDLKWNRLKNRITSLKGRAVLDVGSGNGYYCWRMAGAGAKLVVGIDPTLLNVMQFQAIKKLYGDIEIYILPLGIEDIPAEMKLFDTVFSMGVLYHRRSPIDHLLELKGCLRPGGELILETLVIEGNVDQVLVPVNRYAQMRNVWFIPSIEALQLWMHRCGFKNIQLIDVTKTGVEEQRTTEWMRFQSLQDFLNPFDRSLTCEGLPAPVRATFLGVAD